MSNKDYGTKLAESLRQAKQLDTQTAPSVGTAVAPAKPAAAPIQPRPSPSTTTHKALSSSLHPARVRPD